MAYLKIIAGYKYSMCKMQSLTLRSPKLTISYPKILIKLHEILYLREFHIASDTLCVFSRVDKLQNLPHLRV
jgi:hypothetical protein